MIIDKKKLMTYTYFNRIPDWNLRSTHLFSLVKKNIPGMVRKPFPTMVVDLRDSTFISKWSASTRTKINRAEREGVTVDRGHYLLTDILTLFVMSTASKGLKGYKPEHFDHFPVVECSAISYDGVMLCSHIWVIDREEKRALLYVNATNYHNDNDDKSLTGRAHYFLLWQDGLFLRQKGVETMDLMGYEAHTDKKMLKGVYQWKAGTHGKEEMLYHYYPLWFYVFRKFRNMLTG